MGKWYGYVLSLVVMLCLIAAFYYYPKPKAPLSAEALIRQHILPPNSEAPLPHFVSGHADLNHNGRDELLVLMQSDPFCEQSGCQAYLFDDNNTLVAQWDNVQRPILLGNEVTEGWRNLLITRDEQMYVVTYNGQHYYQDLTAATHYDDKKAAFEAVGLALESSYYQAQGTDLTLDDAQPIFDCETCFLFSYEKLDDDSDKRYFLSVNTATQQVSLLGK